MEVFVGLVFDALLVIGSMVGAIFGPIMTTQQT